MTLIDKAEAQSAVRAYLVNESSEIALNVEQIIAALPARGVGVKQLQWKQAGGDIKAGDGFSAWPDLLGAPITIYRKHDGWWLSSDCKTHPTLDAAKAAAQADYEARILAALAPTDAAQAREAHLREAAAAVRARYMGDNNREDMEVLRCEAAILAMIGGSK